MTKIVAEKSYCSGFDTGYCWSCRRPYYTGHYRTKKEAIEAAKNVNKPSKDSDAAV